MAIFATYFYELSPLFIVETSTNWFISCRDHLAEVEKAAQLYFKKGGRQYTKSSMFVNVEGDEEDKEFEDFPRIASTGQNCVDETPPFTPDLDLVANDNLTWVNTIFEKE